MRARVYIPNFNGAEHLPRVLDSLAAQSRPADVLVVDNGSEDGSAALARKLGAEVLELGENLGFGPALNRAIAAHPAEAAILLNNDTEAEPRFVEALLDELGPGVDTVAGVLVQERAPELIDSAGVVADSTLMGFDHLHGEPLEAAAGAPAPLGPTGGAALYRRAAFEAVGGFDERIFLYYEDLDLALRMAAAGGRCTPTRPASAPPAPASTPAPAGAAATCCAATGSCATPASPCARSPRRERSAPASCCATAPRRGSAAACAAGATAPASSTARSARRHC